jgi:hypothetical protein
MSRPLKTAVALAATAAIAACGVNRAHGAGPETSRSFPVGDFSSIEVAGPYDVQVHTGGKPGVSVKGPQKIVDQMLVEVKGSELRIGQKRDGMFRSVHWGSHSTVIIDVTAPTLDGAAIAGSGDMKVDRVKGSAFRGAVAGSGSLSVASLEVAKLKLEIAGSGDINAAGTATDADYSIAGSGSVNTPKVTSQTLKTSIAGSGDIAAHATDSATISIMGSGDVTVTGGAKCTISKMGSGSANCS